MSGLRRERAPSLDPLYSTPSSSISRRFRSEKRPIVPQLFCSVIRLCDIRIFEDEDENDKGKGWSLRLYSVQEFAVAGDDAASLHDQQPRRMLDYGFRD
jgi:hypothetical protein